MDDALKERFHRCFLCGHLAKWQDIREVAGAWFVGLCRRCLRRAGWGAVEARLRERYGRDRAPLMHPLHALPPPSEGDQHKGDDHRKANAEAPLEGAQVGVEPSQPRVIGHYRCGCVAGFLLARTCLYECIIEFATH
jgi:hypothetical protein